jgi:SAM-dependent methyltransferase
MMPAKLNFQTAPGYEILAAAGKTILRPGGRAATQQLWRWANFKPGDTVLELAAGQGKSAIAIAQKYPVQVVGIEQNPDYVATAQANIRATGLADRVQIIPGNIFHLAALPTQFDYILAEAVLTMQSASGKAQLLQAVYDHLKPNGQFLCHELAARRNEAQLHRTLAAVTRVNSTPLSLSHWLAAFDSAGLLVQHHQTGEMRLLQVSQLVRDEGLLNTLRLIWNLLTQPQLRQRVWQMRQTFQQVAPDMAYLIIAATKDQRAHKNGKL